MAVLRHGFHEKKKHYNTDDLVEFLKEEVSLGGESSSLPVMMTNPMAGSRSALKRKATAVPGSIARGSSQARAQRSTVGVRNALNNPGPVLADMVNGAGAEHIEKHADDNGNTYFYDRIRKKSAWVIDELVADEESLSPGKLKSLGVQEIQEDDEESDDDSTTSSEKKNDLAPLAGVKSPPVPPSSQGPYLRPNHASHAQNGVRKERRGSLSKVLSSGPLPQLQPNS